MLVRSIILEFLEWTKKHRSEATYVYYARPLVGIPSKGKRKLAKKSFDDFLAAKGYADLAVADLGYSHAERWIAAYYPDASDNYKHNLLRALQAPFNWAMKRKELRKIMGENPLTGLETPSATPREVYVDADQWAKIIDNVDGPFKDLLIVLHETGCRPQEARAVEAKHFDREGRRWYFPIPPKKVRGKQEPRIVLLTDTAFEICQRLALKYPAGPLFRNERGRPWVKDALNCAIRRLRGKIGFAACIYSLRHSFATDRLKAGVDPLTVARLMGHKDATMVMRVYNNLGACEDHLRAALVKTANHVA